MNSRLSVGIILALLGSAAAIALQRNPESSLQGKWAVVELQEDGKPIPDFEIREREITLTIEGNKGVLREKTGEWSWRETASTLKIDPAATPKRFDSFQCDIAQLGIYKVEGDKLTISGRPASEGERPTEFSSEIGSKTMLLVLRRQ